MKDMLSIVEDVESMTSAFRVLEDLVNTLPDGEVSERVQGMVHIMNGKMVVINDMIEEAAFNN